MVSIQSLAEVKDRLRIRSLLARQRLAEFLAVFLLIQGSSAQAVTSGGTKGNFFTMFLAGSLGVMLAIYMSGNVSDVLQNYTGGNLTVAGPKEMASIFATYPAPYLSLSNGFLDQRWPPLVLSFHSHPSAQGSDPGSPALSF
ncbi:hypothetical protein G4228_013819 [Cervus hanglu yarkandensis]|nr:hypothetical protein G4228_013819 [Cervus hanglu yarkandensis]